MRTFDSNQRPPEVQERQFELQVFPAELEEIRRRRNNAGDGRALSEGDHPSTRHGLVGLAFSGGGIRSASFSLGVVQHLISKGLFGKVDYLSTVSGGGFTGSCLSALMQGAGHGERLLIDRYGEEEPPALNHVRNSSNYLLPEGLFNQLRLPALLIAGVFHTLLLWLPLVVLAVFVTELFFEVTNHFLLNRRHWLAMAGSVPFVAALIHRPLRADRGTWAERDRADRRLGGWLLIAVSSCLLYPAMEWLGNLVNHDATWLTHQIEAFLSAQRALGARSWLLWAGVFAVLALIVGAVRLRGVLILWLVGTLGPLFLLSLYVPLCIHAINEPLSEDVDGALSGAIAAFRNGPAPGAPSPKVEATLKDLLVVKQMELADYEVQWQTLYDRGDLVLKRRQKASRWVTLLTTRGSPELHIHFDTSWWASSDKSHHIIIDELSLLSGHAEWWLYLSGLLVGLYGYLFVNVNRISLHPFYRDRLSRTFLIAPSADTAEPVAVADDIPLSQLGGPLSSAPYHLLNTALNLQGSSNVQLRQRKTVPFVLAQRFCGSDYTGYIATTEMEAIDPSLTLGAAVAISAAAASPNMGAVTVRPLTFLLAILNIRLNYWVPNPAWIRRRLWLHRLLDSKLGISYLLNEAIGNVDERRPFLNCSDGGHIENLAVYELLRRRCRTIVCVDGEADPSFHFSGFITLQRYAAIDLGAQIDINLEAIRPDTEGVSKRHHAVGTITYNDGELGTFVYLKLSYSGDEPEYLRFYRRKSPAFPHESTGKQFFGETKLESYRALGTHVAEGLTADSTFSVG